MAENNPDLMTIFAEALDRTGPAARAAYLDAACEANDATARRELTTRDGSQAT
jgi:hypothetical protein